MGSDEEDDRRKDNRKRRKKIKEKCIYQEELNKTRPFGPETPMTSPRNNMESSTRVLPITGKTTW